MCRTDVFAGYEIEHDGRLVTVFSAPRYCDSTENKGAYINIEHDLKLNYNVFEAVPHPDIKPMVCTCRGSDTTTDTNSS